MLLVPAILCTVARSVAGGSQKSFRVSRRERLQRLRELPRIPQPPPRLHAHERPHALQLIAGQPRQVTATTRARAVAWHDDAAAEHDVEEGVVGVDDALRPVEEGGAVFSC